MPGDEETQPRQQQDDDQPARGRLEVQGPQGLGDGGHGQGGPHHRGHPVPVLKGGRHVHPVMPQGETVAAGDAHAAL